jgi:tRNA/rRNA methyltransferase
MNSLEALSRIRIVLSHPSHPGNVGAAARAMKTMGLGRLYLVCPKSFPDPEAWALAAGAIDVLDSAQVCASLGEALAGTTLAVAMSARPRDLSHPPLEARAAAQELVRSAQHEDAALVFGNETAGLSNEDVMTCNRLARIPVVTDYASLNLAQAVQVMAYEVRMAAIGPARDNPLGSIAPQALGEFARHEEVEKFYAHLDRSLHASGFLDPKNPRRLMERLRRLFARARLEKEEVNILRGMLSAWDEGNPNKK